MKGTHSYIVKYFYIGSYLHIGHINYIKENDISLFFLEF